MSKTVSDELHWVNVLALTLWITALAVGVLGLMLHYPRPVWRVHSEPVLVAQRMEVELSKEPLAVGSVSPGGSRGAIAAADAPPAAPAPPVIAVAQPNPNIAFPIAVAGPVEIVPVSQAGFVGNSPGESVAGGVVGGVTGGTGVRAVRTLTYGSGEGRQPAPEYPRQAIREGQEGTVVVRMIVGVEGRVMSAEVHEPSPWPLLNESALSCIKRRWRFGAGPVRAFEIPIRFRLKE